MSNPLDQIKIVPVLVLNSLDEGMEICEQLYNNGLPAAEITFRTEAAEAVIRAASEKFPDMYIGAGTVLTAENLHKAAKAGAKFAVAPGLNPNIVKEAQKIGIEFYPGVCNPSDIEAALELGCRTLKFFPAEACGGTKMLKAIAAPYKHLGTRFMPTGGIKPENVESYLEMPEVAAVGGTWLNKCGDDVIRQAAAIAAKYKK